MPGPRREKTWRRKETAARETGGAGGDSQMTMAEKEKCLFSGDVRMVTPRLDVEY